MISLRPFSGGGEATQGGEGHDGQTEGRERGCQEQKEENLGRVQAGTSQFFN